MLPKYDNENEFRDKGEKKIIETIWDKLYYKLHDHENEYRIIILDVNKLKDIATGIIFKTNCGNSQTKIKEFIYENGKITYKQNRFENCSFLLIH